MASPTLSGGTVYLPSSDYNVYAIDVETRGASWVFETENWVWASPLVVDDLVFIASMDHTLYAVHAENGSEAWRFEASGALPAAPENGRMLTDPLAWVAAAAVAAAVAVLVMAFGFGDSWTDAFMASRIDLPWWLL